MATKRDKKPAPSLTTRSRRVRVEAGQIVAVPLCDGSFALAHIARFDLSIWCVLFDGRAHDVTGLSHRIDAALASRPIAVMEVTSVQVRDGTWPVIGSRTPCYPAAMLDTKGHSSVGMLTQMLFEAYYGLRPWDEGWDPKDYEKRLLPGVPVPPTVRYKKDFEKDAAASASSHVPPADAEPPVTDGPAEIHIEIKYPDNALPSIDLLHRRQALEDALEASGAGEVTDAGGGGGVMDIFLETKDVRRALPLVEAAVRAHGFADDAHIETSAPEDAPESS
jgi:hypothetical protein